VNPSQWDGDGDGLGDECDDDAETGTNTGNETSDTMIHTESGLSSNTKYYWKVSASDGNGGETESTVWSFTTE
jgi:hypothetical protein